MAEKSQRESRRSLGVVKLRNARITPRSAKATPPAVECPATDRVVPVATPTAMTLKRTTRRRWLDRPQALRRLGKATR